MSALRTGGIDNDLLSDAALKVQNTLRALGLSLDVVELPNTTRTAAEAAQSIGCRVEQIVKSLVFRGRQSDKPLLILASGANRVNEKKITELAGEPIEKANADFVRQRTGFAIGGVPPVGHLERLETFIDEDLQRYEELWAAAGTAYGVFKLTPAELMKMSGGQVISIK